MPMLQLSQPNHLQHCRSLQSSLWCLSVPDFAQQIPLAHEDISFPFIYVIASKLLLDDTELMPNLRPHTKSMQKQPLFLEHNNYEVACKKQTKLCRCPNQQHSSPSTRTLLRHVPLQKSKVGCALITSSSSALLLSDSSSRLCPVS